MPALATFPVTPFAEWLAALLRERGLNRSQLAAYMGRPAQTVSAWIVEGRIPKTDVCADLARTQDLSAITASPDDPFGDGTWIVAVDINPGTWKAEPTGRCYWARLAGFGGTLGEILANDNADGTAIVTIRPSDRGLVSQRCGSWRRQ